MKKKIVHYIAKLKDGGAQTQLVLLCNQIDRSKYEIVIVCWDKETSIPLSDDIKIILVSRGGIYSLISFFKEIYKLTLELKPDIVQLWMPEVLTLPAAFAAKHMGIPIISCERRLPINTLGKLWLRDRIKYLIHCISTVIVANFPLPIKRKSIFNVILKHKRNQTIYNGLDIDGLKSLRRPFIAKGSAPFKLVYSGRLVSQKNVDVLIRACKGVIDHGIEIELKIFGNGDDERDLIALCKQLELDNYVKFLGYQDNWKELSADSHCFVLPSNREGMPNVLFEAIAIGLPIISTNIEEINCHFTSGYDALLVAPNDAQSLTEAIRMLVNAPELLSVIRSNGLKTAQKYTVKAMTFSYEMLYDQKH
ncbi:glycosyltransferase [Mucilaginibacter sabulilitoris]|uniref:Glycosyltransferase n=1 Tax=Mucilaginibacter sabulilitoris TaxID=1173583 RepID=A0ABZ0TS74_9SPHI|nr:glycosyltransferase [Mucilaginibacter sabulilitoris]WPU95616.1 glycosyltransferase [Mucilaginibacter sabulilitoris]